MKTPSPGSHFRHHVRSGLYTVGRLLRAHMSEQAGSIQQATQTVLQTGRALEDAEFALVDAFAARDATDDLLDTQTQLGRQQLASRGLGADKRTPYTAIFPDGIKWYIAAPLEEQVARYQIFINRCSTQLPEDDTLRLNVVPQIATLLGEWQAASSSLMTRQASTTGARDELEAGISVWQKLMHDSYNTLCIQLSKAQAEQFFLREKAPKKVA